MEISSPISALLTFWDSHTSRRGTSPSVGTSLTVYTRMEAMLSTVGTATIATYNTGQKYNANSRQMTPVVKGDALHM